MILSIKDRGLALRRSQFLHKVFPRMHQVVPACTLGTVSVHHSEISEKRAYVDSAMRNELREPGIITHFEIDGVGWMFDTLHEKWMNFTTVKHSKNDVLLGGLGLGMILWPILKKSAVKSVTVLENNADVIRLILPTLEQHPQFHKLKIIECDALTFSTDQRFDYIWMDVVPAYGYGMKLFEIQDNWVCYYRQFLRKPEPARIMYQVQHWGYEENLLWLLHQPTPQWQWPKEDRRIYPIGPPDPIVAALLDAHSTLKQKIIGNPNADYSITGPLWRSPLPEAVEW